LVLLVCFVLFLFVVVSELFIVRAAPGDIAARFWRIPFRFSGLVVDAVGDSLFATIRRPGLITAATVTQRLIWILLWKVRTRSLSVVGHDEF
jgi:hypothetical protein